MPRLPSTAAFLIGLLVGAGAAAQPTWVELEGSPFNEYRSEDLWFVDADRGWAVDGTGRVHRTTDSGATWAHTATLPASLRSAAYVSPTLGWVGTIHALGLGNRLFETRDGGDSFADITARIRPSTHGICSLFAVSDRVVYGAGTYDGPATLVKTVDGGATWTAHALAPALDTAIDVHFFDPLRGLAVGGTGPYGDTIRPRVIGTTDGGATWTVRHTVEVSPGWGWKLSFPTPEIGYMSVEKYDGHPDSIILKTVDGGLTWGEIVIPGAGGNMQGIGFLTPEIGWISGRGVTSRTTDGGATWTHVPVWGELDPNVNRFLFLDSGIGFASGHKIHRLDARPTPLAPGPDERGGLLRLDPNPARTVVRVRYRPTAPAPAAVDVFDLLGRRVGTAEDAAGDGILDWVIPAGVPAGMYSVRLRGALAEGALPVVILR